MDCFTVSIAGGIIIKRMVWPITLRMALLFGLFQAAMPLLGWLGISTFSHYLEEVDHWIAFGLLTFLGGRMIRDAFLPAENHSLNPCKLKTQLLLLWPQVLMPWPLEYRLPAWASAIYQCSCLLLSSSALCHFCLPLSACCLVSSLENRLNDA